MKFGLLSNGNSKPLTSVPIGLSPSVPAHYTWDWTFPCLLLLLTGVRLSSALLEDLRWSCCECPLNFEDVCIVHQAPDRVVWDFISSKSFVIASLVSQGQQDTSEVWRRFLSTAAAQGRSRFLFSQLWEPVESQRAATKVEKQKGADSTKFAAARSLDWTLCVSLLLTWGQLWIWWPAFCVSGWDHTRGSRHCILPVDRIISRTLIGKEWAVLNKEDFLCCMYFF